MDAYKLYNVVPRLVLFVERLTNIYVRYNRKRLKGSGGEQDALAALTTLYATLLTLCKVRSLLRWLSLMLHSVPVIRRGRTVLVDCNACRLVWT